MQTRGRTAPWRAAGGGSQLQGRDPQGLGATAQAGSGPEGPSQNLWREPGPAVTLIRASACKTETAGSLL